MIRSVVGLGGDDSPSGVGLSVNVKFHHVTGLDPQLCGLACIELQHVPGRPFAWKGRTPLGAAWGCVFRHADQGKIAVEIKYIQRNPAVFHPETAPRLAWEDKQHSMIIRQTVAEHQSQGLFFLRLGQLDAEPLPFEFHIWPPGHAGTAKQKNENETNPYNTHAESLSAP